MNKPILNIAFLCVGCIIGWGAFVMPQDLFLRDIGILNASIGIIIGAILMCVIAYNYSFLLRKIPKIGGEFIFTLKILGKTHGFICGWFLSLAYLCIIPLNATALSLLIDASGLTFLHIIKLYEITGLSICLGDILISCFSVIIVAFINLKGVSVALFLQKILVALLVLSVFIFCAILAFKANSWANLSAYIDYKSLDSDSILKIIAISPWLYLGFDCAVQVIKDIKYDEKIFQALVYISILSGALIYLCAMFIVAFGVSIDDLDKQTFAISSSIKDNFGNFGNIILIVGILSAIFSGINGFFIATSKVMFAMSAHKILPQIFARKNKYGANFIAICFIAIISCVMPFFGRKALLYVVDMSAIGIVVAFFYMGIVSFILKRHYLHKISINAIACVILSLFFAALLFIPASPSALKLPSIIALVCWLFIGIVFYNFKILRS